MSEESRSDIVQPRRLRRAEEELLIELLKRASMSDLASKIPTLLVADMNDENMGSLRFVNASSKREPRFGKQASEVMFKDDDGIEVIATLNVDQDGNLYELDVWKTDFSPTLRLKHPQ